MITVKGTMMANGTEVTDGQIYNYIAKGGTSESDVLVESKVPDYTVIEKEADIGVKLPVMKVNTPTQTGAEVKYAVTDNGVIFIWPPFPHEEKYYVNENETVDADVISNSGELEIKVADKLLKIESNEDGEIQTKEIIYDRLTRKEFEEIKEKVKVGDYVNYTPTSATIQTDPSKTGYATKETLTTDTTVKWRILNIDEETGKVLITTQGSVNNVTLSGATGYLFGVNELHRLCEKLYSNIDKGLVAKSMKIEDLNKECDYTPPTEDEQWWYPADARYAWYPADTPDTELKNVVATNGKVYTAQKHAASLATGASKPRFYTWDDTNGVTHTATNENDYKELKSADEPILTSSTYYDYEPGAGNAVISSILGANRGWLASSMVFLFPHNDMVLFGMRYANSSYITGSYMCFSTTKTQATAYGLRPVVQFSAKLLVLSDTTKTGSESASWEIK